MRKAIIGVLLLLLAACGNPKDLTIEPMPEDPGCSETLPGGIEQVGTFDHGRAATDLAVSAELKLDDGRITRTDIGLDLEVYAANDNQTLVRNYSDNYSVTVRWANDCVQTIDSAAGQHGIAASYSWGTVTLYRMVA